MVSFLTPEWMAEWQARWARSLGPLGPDVAVCFALTGVKEGPDGYWWQLRDGLLEASGLGILEEPDVTFTLSQSDAVAAAKGQADLNAGFMQGRIKVAGDSAKLFSVLAVTASPAYKQLLSELAEGTEFPL